MSRLIHARLILAIAIAVTIGALELGSLIAPTALMPAQERASAAPADAVPMLSTIHVFAPEEIPTLPLVIVRPAPDPSYDSGSMQAVAFVSERAPRFSPAGSSHVPHMRLDMPYYSFGKMLPNVIKD